MTKLLTIWILLILTSCSVGKQGVYYSEVEKPPRLTIENENLVIETRNSIQNSALLIYDLQLETDQQKFELYITGLQAVNKKYKKRFDFKLSDYKISDIKKWTIYWIDPDQKRTEIKLKA